MRVLFADDQIPEDDIPDDRIGEAIRCRYPAAADGFIEAFKVMRRARRAVSEDNDVTVARSFKEAMSLVRNQDFDVAIIDLGWYADLALPEQDREFAGWKIADALDEADRLRPQRPPTAQIIYSARFGSRPELGEIAAGKARLPFPKPYEERFTIPLGSPAALSGQGTGEKAYHQTLRATLTFIGRWQASGTSLQDNVNRNVNLLLNTAARGVARAEARERQWNLLALILASAGALIVLAGVVSLFYLGVPQGAVTAAVGIVTGLVPRLMYGELHRASREIQTATKDLRTLVRQAQGLTGQR